MTAARWQRQQAPLALSFIDIDDFKSVNNQYGHDIGDTVLRRADAAGHWREPVEQRMYEAKRGGKNRCVAVAIKTWKLLFPAPHDQRQDHVGLHHEVNEAGVTFIVKRATAGLAVGVEQADG